AGLALIPSGDQAFGVLYSVIAALALVGFWWFSSRIIDRFAVRLGGPTERATFQRVNGFVYLVLVVYAALGLLQAGLLRAPSSDTAAFGAMIAGGLALCVLVWFIVLTGVAVHTVYRLPALNAAAIALAPYA